jgi:hypothetical protein
MATQKLNLTRDQLATFLKNHEQIKQFERLFQIADEVAPSSDTTGISIQAGNADAAANEALAQIVQLTIDAAINSGNSDQHATQALAQLERIAQALAYLATAPTVQNNNSLTTDYIDLTASTHVNRIRRLAWNSTDQAPEVGMDYDVIQQIGLEWYARVGNTTGSTIPNGSVVGFAGATSNALLVAPYLADGSSNSLYILGVMTHDLPDSGQKGYATVWGFVRDLDTSAFTAGDILYASPTVAGAFTNVKPTAPNNVIPIAACIVADATTGVIFVRPTIEQQKYYGIFTKTTDQTPAVINTEYLLTFDNTQISNGVSIGAPASRIVVPESGLYNFDATVQLTSGSSSAKNIWVWWKKNGTAVANSARLVTSDINNGYIPIALSEFFSLSANDYIEMAFAADSTNVTVDSVAATAFAPAAPAVILNVTQVQQ